VLSPSIGVRWGLALLIAVESVTCLYEKGAAQDHAWRERLSGSPGLAVGINPVNKNAVYAYSGTTLRVSYDRGQQWTALGNPETGTLRQILVHPSDTSISLVAGNGLARSSDHGLTWSIVIADFFIDGESVVLDPIHPDTILAGNYEDGAVYRSTDRGLSWELRSFAGPGLCALAVRPDSAEIIYAGGGEGTIVKSTDGGLTWRLVKETGVLEIPRIAIEPLNPLVAYATAWDNNSAGGMWKTTDGGEQWERAGLEGISLWGMDVDRISSMTVIAGELGGAVYRTTNGGLSWDTIMFGFPGEVSAWNLKIHPLDSDMVWIAAGDIYRWAPSIAAIQGVLLDQATLDTVTNGFIEITSTGDRFMPESGLFSLYYYEDDPTLFPLAHVESFPYYPKDEQVEFTVDSSTTHNINLTRLPQTSIVGSVVDSISQTPLSADVIVTGQSSLGGITSTTSTNPDGTFRIDSLFISYPPIISYESIEIRPDFPHPLFSLKPLILLESVYVLDLLSDTADVLLSSSSGSGDYVEYYSPTLDSLDITYHLWDPAVHGMAPFGRGRELRKRTVIYYTGIDTSSLLEAELDSLSTAFQSGVHMFITGQNFIEANESSAFLSQLVGVNHGGNSTWVQCAGLPADLFSGLVLATSGGTGANNQTSRDIISATDPQVIPTLGYGFDGTQGNAAIRRDSTAAGSRVVLFGFGFESINLEATRTTVMDAVRGYLDGSIVLGVRDDLFMEVPRTYRLDQNFPNPFNPTTNIRYTIPVRSHVRLDLLNTLGERVLTLVNEVKEPGDYTVIVDGDGLATGVYFYRLSSGGFVEARKLVLLR
jgi:photosystem II stability/assembly factor-like uncharacterized protein